MRSGYTHGSHIEGSDIMQPVELQGHLQQTIQTHNALSIGAGGNKTNDSWLDATGFNDLALTVLSDSGTAQFAATILWSNDGSSVQGAEVILGSASGVWANSRAGQVSTKARYFKVVLLNGDASNPHTLSAWATLKA